MGEVKPVNSKRIERDTVVSFQNNHDKILQFYVRKVGEETTKSANCAFGKSQKRQ